MGILNFRKYARVEVNIPINLILEGKQTKAYLSNISEEGTNLIAEKAIPVGTIMEFDVLLPGMEESTHVRADVLWSRPVTEEGEDLFAQGLLFNRIEQDDRIRLHTFIANAMSY